MTAERPDEARAISQRHSLPEIVGRVLAARGLGLDAVQPFMEPRIRDWLPEPAHLLDLDRAVARLVAAIQKPEPIGLIGDYDVDGATSTALVRRYLEGVGASVLVRIPDRLADGYGPNAGALRSLADAGCRLVLCLDSGTTAHGPLERRVGWGSISSSSTTTAPSPPSRRRSPSSTPTGSTRRAPWAIWPRSASPSCCWSP
jgi:single-stranded-DNA-specific exonuclease